jgi:hypothetical protein
VVVDISDTGHGMSQETLSKLFQPFFTTKPRGKGTGWGCPSATASSPATRAASTCAASPARAAPSPCACPWRPEAYPCWGPRGGGPACRRAWCSSSVKRRERMRKRTPSGASARSRCPALAPHPPAGGCAASTRTGAADVEGRAGMVPRYTSCCPTLKSPRGKHMGRSHRSSLPTGGRAADRESPAACDQRLGRGRHRHALHGHTPSPLPRRSPWASGRS